MRVSKVEFTGYGHWKVTVEQDYFSKPSIKNNFHWKRTSVTTWVATILDSELIDDYKDGKKKARKDLIRMVRRVGTKTNIKR